MLFVFYLFLFTVSIYAKDTLHINLNNDVLDSNINESISEIFCWINYNIEKNFLSGDFYIDNLKKTQKLIGIQVGYNQDYLNSNIYREFLVSDGSYINTYINDECNLEYNSQIQNNFYCNNLKNCSYFFNNSLELDLVKNLSHTIYRAEAPIIYNNLRGIIQIQYFFESYFQYLDGNFYRSQLVIKLNNIEYLKTLGDLFYASIWSHKLDCLQVNYIEIIVVSCLLFIIFIVLLTLIVYPIVCKNKNYCRELKNYCRKK